MSIISIVLEFWWLALLAIPMYFIYMRTRRGEGIASFGADSTKLIFIYLIALIIIYLFQKFIFKEHLYLIFYILILFPIFAVFIYLLLLSNNVLIIESTMDTEIFYDFKKLEKRYADCTRTRAFAIDRDAYQEIRHVGEIEYPYWNGGDGVKFTDYFDEKDAVMYHPPIGALHNISFFIAKSFWLKMKEDLPDLMRQNAMLTWLAPYKTAYEQTKLARNFKLRLQNIERQYEDEPFTLPDDIRKLYERELEQRRRDREAGEIKIPIEPQQSAGTPATPESSQKEKST